MDYPVIEITLKAVRQRIGISQRELSKMSGVSHGYISELESNLKSPTIDTLCKLARALECKPDDLYIFQEG